MTRTKIYECMTDQIIQLVIVFVIICSFTFKLPMTSVVSMLVYVAYSTSIVIGLRKELGKMGKELNKKELDKQDEIISGIHKKISEMNKNLNIK